ncbi:MAG: hypothetical protein PHU99_08030 [Candidatus Cloacimonetes bacterium]|nr:hypothetical protein [Candidatus Cloacimonadota bacterium]MCK9333706.1 hypothetical protein [Candidatus Cloacimonadota bacterium]MDD2543575.1 hypothetical protein [Candidatus Cloacimonadota bacterium]MDD3097651.1 hypothetical protein [Candidatus Cloacimonadota bacterium]MDY0337187.1 hypothetical protein [Candidatus Cloacimonadaceae bacterium]
MAYNAKVIRIFITSPGDVQKERGLTRETIHEWNMLNSVARGIILLPVGWETDSVSSYGAPPQDDINMKLLKSCDLLIGVFWSKLGTPTDQYPSGSVEEIELHASQGKQIMLFFSKAAIPQSLIDEKQLAALRKFRKSINGKCLYKEYEDSDKFKELLSVQLSAKLQESWVLADNTLANPIAETIQDTVKATDIVKFNITKWSEFLNLQIMSDWISCLTTASPYISVPIYEQLEKLTQWILTRDWKPEHTLYSDSFYKFRLILRDLLDVIMSSSDVTDREIYRVEKRYNNIEWNPDKYEKLANDYNFRVELIQDLASELCRATNFILDMYRRDIDPMFYIDTGRIYITTGMHEDLRYHFHVVRFRDEDTTIPYSNLNQFKIERKNRDISMGRGISCTDPEFLEWNNRC